ncbi:MAG: hypothetical protein HC778_04515, partial [Chamaesiphon sp. CSU_1_12]|nr:hypothetical protein [Chamaesiphon sp. CSU_1_12]
DRMDEEIYEQQIGYLDRGLKLAETLADKQSLALCYHSLGLAYLTIQQPEKAIEYLQQGTKAAQAVGDLYLQGLNLTYLAEANHSLQKNGTAVFYSLLGNVSTPSNWSQRMATECEFSHCLTRTTRTRRIRFIPN